MRRKPDDANHPCVGSLGVILAIQLFGHGVNQTLPEARTIRKGHCLANAVISHRQDMLGAESEANIDRAGPALWKRVLQRICDEFVNDKPTIIA